MLVLIIYSYILKEFSPSKISKFTKTDSVFKLIMEGTPVSRTSINRYRNHFRKYYHIILSKSLEFALEHDITNFNTVSVDGTIIKAYNSYNNFLRKKELRKLLRILKSDRYGVEDVKKLKKVAQRFYFNKNMTVEQKIEFLEEAYRQMKSYKKKKIPLFDIEARWMKNKKGKDQISYNVQTCVDTQSQLIMSVYNSQNATDHYELPPTVRIALENSPIRPEKVLADAGYDTETTYTFLKTEKLEGFVYNASLSRIEKGNRRLNPFSMDNITINYSDNYILSFSGHPLFNKYTYIENNKEKEKKGYTLEEKHLYVNFEACKDCFMQEFCLSKTQTHKTYTISGSPDKRGMKEKMIQEEAKDEYSSRASTSEPPYAALKFQYLIDQLAFIGRQKIEDILNLCAVAYNLNKIFTKLHTKLLFEDENYQNFIKQKIEQYTA